MLTRGGKPAAPLFMPCCLPGPANRVGFSVENYFVQVEHRSRRKRQVQVFERFGEKIAWHLVRKFQGGHVMQSGITGIRFAAMGQVTQKS